MKKHWFFYVFPRRWYTPEQLDTINDLILANLSINREVGESYSFNSADALKDAKERIMRVVADVERDYVKDRKPEEKSAVLVVNNLDLEEPKPGESKEQIIHFLEFAFLDFDSTTYDFLYWTVPSFEHISDPSPSSTSNSLGKLFLLALTLLGAYAIFKD
jgi:hypothetical protein